MRGDNKLTVFAWGNGDTIMLDDRTVLVDIHYRIGGIRRRIPRTIECRISRTTSGPRAPTTHCPRDLPHRSWC
jgi:hypothetical protein